MAISFFKALSKCKNSPCLKCLIKASCSVSFSDKTVCNDFINYNNKFNTLLKEVELKKILKMLETQFGLKLEEAPSKTKEISK
jgi:hypothetical protein